MSGSSFSAQTPNAHTQPGETHFCTEKSLSTRQCRTHSREPARSAPPRERGPATPHPSTLQYSCLCSREEHAILGAFQGIDHFKSIVHGNSGPLSPSQHHAPSLLLEGGEPEEGDKHLPVRKGTGPKNCHPGVRPKVDLGHKNCPLLGQTLGPL